MVSRHLTQDEAIRQARLIARSSIARGVEVQILVQRPNGIFRVEWTYGRDPFPPRG